MFPQIPAKLPLAITKSHDVAEFILPGTWPRLRARARKAARTVERRQCGSAGRPGERAPVTPAMGPEATNGRGFGQLAGHRPLTDITLGGPQ
jgi:hypothetical protein